MAIEEVVKIRSQGLKYRYQSKWDHDMEVLWSFKSRGDHLMRDKKAVRNLVVWFNYSKINFISLIISVIIILSLHVEDV